MESIAESDYSEEMKTRVFDHLGIPFDDVEDLHGFENFVYGAGKTVIRVTHDSHRTQEQLLGELEFISFLAERGASVAKPLPLTDGAFVNTVGPFHICRFERAGGLAQTRPFDGDVIEEWGRCIGEFHRLSRGFSPVHVRQDWEVDENHQFARRIPGSDTEVLAAAATLMNELRQLPCGEQTFGLIHSDAHAGNFLCDDGRLTFFDFDDSLYTWYGYDVATIFFGVALQPWIESDDQARADAVAKFVPVFLRGYEQENAKSALMLDQFHRFLKLREFSLYAVIHAHMDPDNTGDAFAAKFMAGRKARLEQALPYLDIDFSAYA